MGDHQIESSLKMLLEAIEQLVPNWWLGMSCDRRLLNSLGTKANFVVSRLVLDGPSRLASFTVRFAIALNAGYSCGFSFL